MQTLLRAALAATTIAAGAGAALFACSNGESGFGDATDGGDGGLARDGASTPDGADDLGDAGPSEGADASFDLCARTAAYEIGCGRASGLTCGDAGFSAWCAQNDKIVNSAQFDKAELGCLTMANCAATPRHDCDYRAYGSDSLDTAQANMVKAYCQTCEPLDVMGCTKRQTTYDPKAGPDSVSDVFVAAWELSDSLVDQVRTKCTGAALDAGADASTDAGITACAKAFSNCSGGVYVDALPNCPK